MHNMLKKIISEKKKQLTYPKNKKFIDALLRKKLTIIGEIKFASPTNPAIGSVDDIEKKVRAYETAGLDALSIITERNFFKGDTAFVSKIKQITTFPILQKDFVIDDSQIYEAKFLGSDALLFIARILSREKLKKFVLLAQKLGIEPVVEVVNKKDLEKAVLTTTKIIAVNARDLDTFKVNVEKATDLIRQIPRNYMRLGFSGILTTSEVELYKKAGVKGVLIGTSLMEAKNEAGYIRSLGI